MSDGLKILFVDDEKEYREVIAKIIRANGYEIDLAENSEVAFNKIEANDYDLLLSDLVMKDIDGLQLMAKVKEKHPSIEVIIITGYGSVKNAVDAMKKGAFSYFIKSNNPDELLIEIEKIKKLKGLKDENKQLKKEVSKTGQFMLETKSPKFQKVLSMAKKVSNSDVNVLILGESGVGKEVLAKYIHQNSHRKDEKFVAVNCHTYSKSLLESELFGHEKGAFTGAHKSKAGKFEVANRGTVFLDEVGEIPLESQSKLLSVLEKKQIQRVGSNEIINLDFRLICATNRNIHSEIEENNFREDLFYRIGTIVLEIPPLRERKEDLHELIRFFVKKYSGDLKCKIERIDPEVMDQLYEYNYPGNIRELKNIIERLVVLSEDGVIKPNHMNFYRYKNEEDLMELSLKEFRDKREKEYIEEVIKRTDGNITKASEILKISRRQLYNKINDLNIEV